MRNLYTRFSLVVTLASSLLMSNAYAENTDTGLNFVEPSVTPANYDKVFTYIADNPFYSVDGSFFTNGFMNTNANYFFKTVMHRTDAQIDQQRADALAFFQKRFGLTLNTPGVIFKDVEITPDIRYRVTAESGEFVPRDGFYMDDVAWVFNVVNPQGVTLGGEFAGRVVPFGTMVAYGEYYIHRTKKMGKKTMHHNSLIHYQSIKPLVPEQDGFVILACELSSEEYGDGMAMGVVTPFPLSDGRMVYNITTTLTFPKWGKLVPANEGWKPMPMPMPANP